MKIKETLTELSGILMLGGFSDDSWKLQDIVLLFDINQNLATSRLLKMFNAGNGYFDRVFSGFDYPERDNIQKKFRAVRDKALNDLEEIIPHPGIYTIEPIPRRKYKKRTKDSN